MSTNDVVTALLALGAIAVSVVALVINAIAGRRAARSALTDLALKIGKEASVYRDIPNEDEGKFAKCQEIEVLVRQADYLVDQLHGRFPEAIGITLAQTLGLLSDYSWADQYWEMASRTKDEFFRAETVSYWGYDLWARGEFKRSRKKIEEAAGVLTAGSTNAHITRGEIYRTMGERDTELAPEWFAKARSEYEAIPPDDGRHGRCLGWLADSCHKAGLAAGAGGGPASEVTSTAVEGPAV